MNGSPKLIILCGLPYSGKTTFAERMGWLTDTSVNYFSFDQALHHIAIREGKDYNTNFKELFPLAEKEVKEAYQLAIQLRRPKIILDMTHLTVQSRHKKLANIPAEYEKICYVFPEISDEELKKRVEDRPEQVIPMHVLETMKKIYEKPTLKEGFDEIVYLGDDLVVKAMMINQTVTIKENEND